MNKNRIPSSGLRASDAFRGNTNHNPDDTYLYPVKDYDTEHDPRLSSPTGGRPPRAKTKMSKKTAGARKAAIEDRMKLTDVQVKPELAKRFGLKKDGTPFRWSILFNIPFLGPIFSWAKVGKINASSALLSDEAKGRFNDNAMVLMSFRVLEIVMYIAILIWSSFLAREVFKGADDYVSYGDSVSNTLTGIGNVLNGKSDAGIAGRDGFFYLLWQLIYNVFLYGISSNTYAVVKGSQISFGMLTLLLFTVITTINPFGIFSMLYYNSTYTRFKVGAMAGGKVKPKKYKK